jgi:hypothetical protein
LGESDTPYEDIEAAFHALHAKREKSDAVRVAWLAYAYLAYVKEHRAAATDVWYSTYLNAFAAHTGDKMRVGNLTPAIVNGWIGNQYPDGSPSCHHAAARSKIEAAVRCCRQAHSDKAGDQCAVLRHAPDETIPRLESAVSDWALLVRRSRRLLQLWSRYRDDLEDTSIPRANPLAA